MIETVRVSEKARIQLINIKKRTGIQNWNVICRWAFLLSISEEHRPPAEDISTDSSVEMPWKTFTGGGKENLYAALLLLKAKKDGIQLKDDQLANYFKLHLHRGISYLNSQKSASIKHMLRQVTG